VSSLALSYGPNLRHCPANHKADYTAKDNLSDLKEAGSDAGQLRLLRQPSGDYKAAVIGA
jgi:hypothetical protein